MTTNTPASRKNKGRILQKWVVEKILSLSSELTPDDVRSTPMGVTGSDVQLSNIGKKIFPYMVECKNRDKIAVYKFIEQHTKSKSKQDLDDHTGLENKPVSVVDELEPLVIIKQNRSKPLVVIDAEYYFNLLRKLNYNLNY